MIAINVRRCRLLENFAGVAAVYVRLAGANVSARSARSGACWDRRGIGPSRVLGRTAPTYCRVTTPGNPLRSDHCRHRLSIEVRIPARAYAARSLTFAAMLRFARAKLSQIKGSKTDGRELFSEFSATRQRTGNIYIAERKRRRVVEQSMAFGHSSFRCSFECTRRI